MKHYKFTVKAIMAMISFLGAIGITWYMMSQPEFANQTETGIMLGVLASSAATAFKSFFEDGDKKGDEDG